MNQPPRRSIVREGEFHEGDAGGSNNERMTSSDSISPIGAREFNSLSIAEERSPMTPMLIDEFLPVYDRSMHHHIEIDAPPEKVYPVVRQLDLTGAYVFRVLVWLRSVPALLQGRQPLGFTLEDLERLGLIRLGEASPHELVLGFVGKLWTTTGDFQKLEPSQFREFATPGYAKVVWNFTLRQSVDGRTHLATESRVQCLDEASRRKFQRYFFFMGPVSSQTRRSALRALKRQAEG